MNRRRYNGAYRHDGSLVLNRTKGGRTGNGNNTTRRVVTRRDNRIYRHNHTNNARYNRCGSRSHVNGTQRYGSSTRNGRFTRRSLPRERQTNGRRLVNTNTTFLYGKTRNRRQSVRGRRGHNTMGHMVTGVHRTMTRVRNGGVSNHYHRRGNNRRMTSRTVGTTTSFTFRGNNRSIFSSPSSSNISSSFSIDTEGASSDILFSTTDTDAIRPTYRETQSASTQQSRTSTLSTMGIAYPSTSSSVSALQVPKVRPAIFDAIFPPPETMTHEQLPKFDFSTDYSNTPATAEYPLREVDA